MKIVLAIVAAIVAALAFTSSASAASTPYLSAFSAKSHAGPSVRSYVDFRMDSASAWDDPDATVYWDDSEADSPKCKRVSRAAVDCKLRVQLFETAYDDPDSYTASEDCRWTMRYRRTRGGFVSAYQLFEGGGSGGDIGSVTCVGWYGE